MIRWSRDIVLGEVMSGGGRERGGAADENIVTGVM
jgi:hypothetical protein